MSAVIQPELSARERAEVRKRVFEREWKDPVRVADSLHDSHKWHALLMNGDVFAAAEEMKRIYSQHLEACGDYERAEQEVLSSKSISGARFYEV